MAKQKGIIPIVGTLGGFNFYYLKGKPIVRVAGGGFNGKAIKTKASMQRVRENGSEFGHCSRVNKIFRQALHPFYAGYTFSHFHSRLMTLFTRIKTLDTTSARGARRVGIGVDTAVGVRELCDFEYTPDCRPHTVLPFPFSMDWGTYTLSISDVDVAQIPFISGATHVVVQFGVLDFDFETLNYQLHLADAVPVSKTFSDPLISMTPNTVPSGSGTLLAVCGVRYYQEVAGVLYELNRSEAVGIEVVGVF
ncbi:hypothetical protein [Formosa sp. 4Alg 33]|uniref:hypothetical protein n=1 Tax=Formosa sp. 4Alg 33 TaxID=3382189 RepID=UPI003D9C2462